ncbi:MAG: 2-dehydropantoate 2-reductase N-terminal domain-containing protein [Planctomycetota bacterium]
MAVSLPQNAKISVLGSGAIGTMLGGLIKHALPSSELVLIARGDHGAAMAESGQAVLDGPWPQKSVRVHATEDLSAIEGSQVVLVTVKSQATGAIVAAAAPHLGDATVVSVQNGFNDAALLQHVAPEKLVMGITATNVTVPKPGSASLQFVGTLVVGPNESRSNVDAAALAAETLRHTGFRVFTSQNLRGVRYNKLAINSPGYAASLSASNFITECVCHGPWRNAVGIPLADECTRVFEAACVELERIPKLPDIRKLRGFFDKLNLPVIGAVMRFGAKQIYNKRPIQFSLHQDLLRGKGTEVDLTNGEIVRLADEHGQKAPYNQLVIDLTHEIEARGAGKFLTREDVIDRFRAI